jgi:endonuclease/exonuclease/phosphatase family metal-dependent hydrolase
VRLATLNMMGGRSLAGQVLAANELADAIASLDADVLALQEVDRSQPRSGSRDFTAEIAMALGAADAKFGPTLIGTPGGRWRPVADDTPVEASDPAYGVALVSRLPVSQWSVTRLRSSGLYAPLAIATARGWRVLPVKDEPRVMVAATVETAEGPLTVASAHLSFIPGWNVKQLRRCIGELRKATSPRFLMGDFNLPPVVVRRASGWHSLVDGGTWPSHRPRVQLDHVLSSEPQLRVASARTCALAVSDHRALVVELELPHS